MSPETVRSARDRFLATIPFDPAAYAARDFPVQIGRWRLRLPHPGKLHLHDLHHVATGRGTGWIGEAEVSMFEIRSGSLSPLILLYCLAGVILGMIMAPRRVLRAWRLARGARSLYRSEIPYETLLDMSLAELRLRLGLPADGFTFPGGNR
jgi:hypothetical protein